MDNLAKALLTWYPEDNPLHMDIRHPAIKLAGEAGEILDLYGKNEFKPGFDWWNCKSCGEAMSIHVKRRKHWKLDKPGIGGYSCERKCPLILDELGDLWYYLRILAYQTNRELKELDRHEVYGSIPYGKYSKRSIDKILSVMAYASARFNLLRGMYTSHLLDIVYTCLLDMLDHLDTSLDELTELNYIKLNSDNTNHGWKGAGE